MRNVDAHTITPAVIDRLASADDPRLRQILTALVTHLHDFAREVELTETEWMQGIEFLTATGHQCDAKRQEFILLSDTLGLSMLVVGAEVDVWQADDDGHYDVQRPELGDTRRARGVLHSDTDGTVRFRTVTPTAYPVPTDGPVGRMLLASGRHPWRPAHLHFRIRAPGYQTLVTHIFRDGDPYLDSDVVFGVRSSLIGSFVRHEPGPAPDGTPMAVPFYCLDQTFRLAPVAGEG